MTSSGHSGLVEGDQAYEEGGGLTARVTISVTPTVCASTIPLDSSTLQPRSLATRATHRCRVPSLSRFQVAHA